jgi:hypothetical protein
MATNDLVDEQATADVHALLAWLNQSEEGQSVLTRFRANPHSKPLALSQWLQAHEANAPSQVATYITGGQVEKLITIAHAKMVVIQTQSPPHPTPQQIREPVRQTRDPVRDFTGRTIELDELMAAREQGGIIISGMGGIGKTELALSLAKCLASYYSDAQFYLDLRGTSDQPPMSVREAKLLSSMPTILL